MKFQGPRGDLSGLAEPRSCSGGGSSESQKDVWKESELLGGLWIKVGSVGTVTVSREAESESY